MNREEKAERFDQVKNIGKYTKEGRLKIEKIKEYKSTADESILYSILFTIAVGLDGLLYLLSSTVISNELIKSALNAIFALCGITNVGRSIYFTIKRFRNEKLAYDLEEEVLNQLIIKN